MEIVINGEAKQVAAPLSVAELLEVLDLKADRIAVELNRQIVRRENWPAARLNDQDRLEIVQFVGGG